MRQACPHKGHHEENVTPEKTYLRTPRTRGDLDTLQPLCLNEFMAKQVMDVDWSVQYAKCPKCGPTWRLVQDTRDHWPVSYKRLRGSISLAMQ